MLLAKKILSKQAAIAFCLLAVTAISAWAKMYSAPKTAAAGSSVVVTYKEAMASPTENKYWITIIDPGAADSEWGAWVYVEDGATSTTLKAPETPGAYEIRLHANYPAKPYEVVQRSPLTVK